MVGWPHLKAESDLNRLPMGMLIAPLRDVVIGPNQEINLSTLPCVCWPVRTAIPKCPVDSHARYGVQFLHSELQRLFERARRRKSANEFRDAIVKVLRAAARNKDDDVLIDAALAIYDAAAADDSIATREAVAHAKRVARGRQEWKEAV